jgi:hypothetical protein
MVETVIHFVPLVLVVGAAYLAVALPLASFVGRTLAAASAPPGHAHRIGSGARPLDPR